MNRCIIADAGVLVAMLVRNDQHHAWTKEQASRISRRFFRVSRSLRTLHICSGDAEPTKPYWWNGWSEEC